MGYDFRSHIYKFDFEERVDQPRVKEVVIRILVTSDHLADEDQRDGFHSKFSCKWRQFSHQGLEIAAVAS